MTHDPDPDCETCGGEGEVFDDRPDRRGEHTTIHRPCPDCAPSDDAALETADEVRRDRRGGEV